jgi:hypothetical protein
MKQMKARGILHTHTLGIIYVLQVIMVEIKSHFIYLYSIFYPTNVVQSLR